MPTRDATQFEHDKISKHSGRMLIEWVKLLLQ